MLIKNLSGVIRCQNPSRGDVHYTHQLKRE